jgi:hypothetical protein
VRQTWTLAISRFLRRTGAASSILFFSTAGHAQSCALCYTQAASSGARIIQGLRSGILVLVIPPLFMSVGITVLAYRKRNQFSRGASSDQSRNDW